MHEHDRIEELAGQVRRLRRMNAVMIGAVGLSAMLAAGSLRSVPPLVQAERFEVIDPSGERVVSIGWNHAGGVLEIFNAGGGSIAAIESQASDRGGVVRTFDGDGQTLVRLGATTTGQGTLTTFNSSGDDLVRIGATTTGAGAIRTLNGRGQSLVRLGATVEGQGMLSTFDGSGQDLVRLGATASGEGMVTTVGSNGQDLVRLGAERAGHGTVEILDRSGRLRRTLP